mgnify:CR=1 FL=1
MVPDIFISRMKGVRSPKKTFERHRVLTKVFTKLGVSAGIAAEDACKIEHVISDETFEAIKRFVAEHSD